MANARYPKFWKNQNNGNAVNLLTATLKWVLVDTALYTYGVAHEFLSDIAAGARLAMTAALANKTINDLAVLDADDPSLTDPGGGATAEAIVLFVDTGDPATSKLIAYLDSGVTGLPYTLDGTNDSVQHNASGVITL